MSFGRALDKFAEGFTKGVELADRHSYNKAATDRIRKPTESEVETETTPLEDGGGTITKSPSTSGGTTKTDDDKSAPAKTPAIKTKDTSHDDVIAGEGSTEGGTLTGSRGSDTLADSGGNDELIRRRRGIQSIESSGNYQALGPVTKDGDRAYGAYQIMGKNVGPWTKAVLGRAMTPDEFLKDEKAQDAVFDHQFGGYVDKYGLEGAAQAWLGGPGSVGKKRGPSDQLGTSTNVYGQRFMDAYNGKGGASKLAGAGKTGGDVSGDRLIDSGPVVGTRPDAGAIPEFMNASDSGDDSLDGSDSASLMIQAPEVNTATPGYSGLPELDTEWAKGVGFADGGAIPDNQFGWGNILGRNLLEGQGSATPAAGRFTATPNAETDKNWAGGLGQVGAAFMGPQAGFGRASPGGSANLGAGAPSYAAGYNRDVAEATAPSGDAHWQPNAPAPSQYQQQLAAYNAQVAANARLAAAAAKAQQDDLAADAARKAALNKKIKDDAAKKAAATAAALKKAKAKETAPAVLAAQDVTSPDVTAIGGGGGMSPEEVAWAIKKSTWPQKHGGQELSDWNSPMAWALRRKVAAGQTLTPEEQKAYDMYRGSHVSAASRHYEGGVIPEPGQTSFRKGGKVQEPSTVDDDGYFTRPKASNRDERFKQLLAEEERSGGRGGASGNARDRAARRLSVEEGRAPSTAYRPGGGGARREGAPARSGETRVKLPAKTDVVPTPRPDTEITPVAAGTPTQGYEPGQGYTATPEPTPGAAGTPTSPYEPKTKIAGRPDVPISDNTPVIPDPDAVTTATPPKAEPVQPQGPAYGGAKPDTLAAKIVTKMPAQPEDTVIGGLQKKLREQGPPDNVNLGKPRVDPRYGDWVLAANRQMASGRDPKEIAATLSTLGLPPEYWPQKLKDAMEQLDQPPAAPTPPIDTGGPYSQKDLNNFLGFEKGGAIPDPESGGGSFFAGVDNEAAAEGRTEKLQPTPKLMGHVAQAAHGGLQYLKNVFGMGGGDGAIATPEDPAMRQDGARRMASGEGAATPDEIARTDQAIDPDGRLATHDKTMLRMAKTYQWYLEQGRKDEADAVAASLLQFGASRTQHLGSLAAAAYSKYQESGNPKDLDAAAGAIEEAYKYIPNGGDANISIGPNGTLQVQHTDADGNVENVDIGPNEIPGLLKSAMDGSYYWGEIAKVADPKGYESRLTTQRQIAEDERSRREWDRQHGITSAETEAKEERTAKRAQEEWDRQHGITQEDKKAEEKRAAEEHDREARYAAEIAKQQKLMDAALDEAKQAAKGPTADQAAKDLPGALTDYGKAKKAYDADKSPENKQQLDAATNRVFKAYNYDAAKTSAVTGVDMSTVDQSAEAAPYPGWTLNTSAKDGQKYWVSPDGKQKTLATGAPAS